MKISIEKAKVNAKGVQEYYFVIKSRNGQVLATSETYQRKSSARKTINALLKAGLKATVVE